VPRLSAHLLAPAVAAVISLGVPFVPGGETKTVGQATSVTAKAAQADGRPADQRFPVGGRDLQIARDVARAHWGTEACGGDVEYRWATLEEGTNATATWRNPTDAWNNAAANFDCSIELNADARYDFAKLCTVVAHEVGHLAGRQHAARAGELMSAFYSRPLPACTAADPARAQPVAATAATKSAGGKKARRCVTRLRAGRRVKRCTTARTARKASARRTLRRA
jgi:Matrixin